MKGRKIQNKRKQWKNLNDRYAENKCSLFHHKDITYNNLFYKSVVSLAQAEYSYFSADFSWKHSCFLKETRVLIKTFERSVET